MIVRTRCTASRLIAGLATAALLSLGAAGLSVAQTAAKPDDESGQTGKRKNEDRQESISRNVNGQQVSIDPATGRLRQPTPEEAQQLAASLHDMLSHSMEGLQVVQLPDGTLMVDLEDRFQEFVMARVDAQGTLSLSCVNEKAKAEAVLKGQLPPAASSKPAAKPEPGRAEEK